MSNKKSSEAAKSVIDWLSATGVVKAPRKVVHRAGRPKKTKDTGTVPDVQKMIKNHKASTGRPWKG